MRVHFVGSNFGYFAVFWLICTFGCSRSENKRESQQPQAQGQAESLTISRSSASREVRWGVVFINKQAKYITYGYNRQLLLPLSVRKKYRGRPLPNGELLWRNDRLYAITLVDDNFDIFDGNEKKMFYYKIEGDQGFLSEDEVQWFPLMIRVISERSFRSTPPEMFMTRMTLYLECPWFKGIYEVTDDLPHAHPMN